MDEELMNLADSMSHEIDPTFGNAIQPEASIEELSDDTPNNEETETEEAGNEAEAADESNETEESDEEVSEEVEEPAEDEDLLGEEADTETESSDDESSNDVSEESHKVTVDGEEVEVSLQDLKENFAGQQAWDKKFQELGNEKQEHQAKVEQFNTNAKQFSELVGEGKAQEALDFVLEVAGLNRDQFVEAYVSQLAPTIAEHLELSPAEREQRALKQQVETLKAREAKAQEAQTQTLKRQELKGQVDESLSKYDMSTERFEELQKELIEFGMKDLTPDAVGQYHVMINQQDAAIEVLNEINPDLVKDKSAMDYLLSLQKNNPGIAKEELKARAEKAFVDALTERVKKDSKATKPRKKGSTKSSKKGGKDNLTLNDDLDEILDMLN